MRATARSERESPRGAVVLRFSGIYGPGRLLRRIESLRKGEPIGGNPDGFLNLIHVDDGARVVAALAERGQLGSTYLVTDGRPVRRREYYALLARLTGGGTAEPTFRADATLQAESSRAHGFNKRCTNARIRADLEDSVRFCTLEAGLTQAITNGSAPPAE